MAVEDETVMSGTDITVSPIIVDRVVDAPVDIESIGIAVKVTASAT